MKFAIHLERHRGVTAVETALMIKHPSVWRSRGFMSSYTSTKRRGQKRPDPAAIKLIADYLHVSFEWLLLGAGPVRRGGRGQTPAEEAMFTARDWGVRSDACEIAWERNKDRADSMTAQQWYDAIRFEEEQLDRAGVPRPEALAPPADPPAARATPVPASEKRARPARSPRVLPGAPIPRALPASK